MNYIEIGKVPPRSKNELSTPEQLVENLKSLIGEKFPLTGKPRTDGLNVYSYDKKSKKKKYYIKDLKKEEDFLNDNLKIDNNKLYYSTNNMDVFMLDIKTGEIKKIASESKNNKNSAWTSVIFTKSYIVIDITGEDYKNRKMYIYSYDGKLIRKVNVQPVW